MNAEKLMKTIVDNFDTNLKIEIRLWASTDVKKLTFQMKKVYTVIFFGKGPKYFKGFMKNEIKQRRAGQKKRRKP